MLIHYQDGRVLAGILLSLMGNQMRVAVKDEDDVVEYQLLHGLWVSECCEPVTFEFPTAIFSAVGIVPDVETINPQPDFWVNREDAGAAAIDRPN